MRLIALISIIALSFVSCERKEVPERCAYCYYNNTDRVYSYICEDYLNSQSTMTLEEWTSYWDATIEIECHID